MRPSGISPGSRRASVKRGSSCRTAGIDGTLHFDERLQAKPLPGEPMVGCSGIGDGEGGEVNAGIARQAGIELTAQRRVGSPEQRFDIAAREHRGHIARAGKARRASVGIGIDLDRDRSGRETCTHEGAGRSLRIGHEMTDVVEENLLADRKLAIRFELLRFPSPNCFLPLVRCHARFSSRASSNPWVSDGAEGVPLTPLGMKECEGAHRSRSGFPTNALALDRVPP